VDLDTIKSYLRKYTITHNNVPLKPVPERSEQRVGFMREGVGRRSLTSLVLLIPKQSLHTL